MAPDGTNPGVDHSILLLERWEAIRVLQVSKSSLYNRIESGLQSHMNKINTGGICGIIYLPHKDRVLEDHQLQHLSIHVALAQLHGSSLQ